MATSEIGDPRLQELFGPEAAMAAGVKPVVRLGHNGPSNWVIAAFVLCAALLLFFVLESKREAKPAPQVRPRGEIATFSPEPPPLFIPPAPPPSPPQGRQLLAPAPERVSPPELERRQMPVMAPQIVYERPAPQPPPMPVRGGQTPSGPALVLDATTQLSTQPGVERSVPGTAQNSSQWGGRAHASPLANRSNTVPQGAMIPAVLETALNSTSAGLARAIVSRDVRGFDGKKVLIPRGSRLIGHYESGANPGQKRALITWTRLLRPDGVTIDLNSPATDPLGRGGVRAEVNSHFWTRFGDALLGAATNIGTALGTRAISGSLIVSVPGSVSQSAGSVQSSRAVPTLSVKAGTSISVFVARDLEFPGDGEAK